MLNNSLRQLLLGVLSVLLFVLPALAQSGAGAENVKVTVLPFVVHAADELNYLEQSLPELLSDRLHEAGFEVVDQAEVQKLLQDRQVATVTPDVARELALLGGAGFAVYGTFNQLGEDLIIEARLVDAYGSGEGKRIEVVKSGLINLLPAVDELVARMKSDLLRVEVVSEVVVQGTKVLDKEVVEMRMTLRKGDILTAQAINIALRNIYDLGYFDDVRVKVDSTPEGKKVIFDVVEKPRIMAVGVSGSDAIDADDILEAVSTRKGGVINPKVLADDIRVVREMYRKDGYYKAKVTHEIEDGGNGQARLTFVIDEGPKLYVEKIVIDGAEQLDPDDVKSVLAMSEHGIFSWINDSGVLKEELLERDAAAIGAYYNNNGFLNARVGRPEVIINDDGITIVHKIWEGDRSKVGTVSFQGDLIDEPSKLLNITAIDDQVNEDDYFNRSLLREDVEKLTGYYNNYGYAHAEVDVKLNDNPESHVVDVVYLLNKHQKVRIRRVMVQGNTSTRDNVILREMRLADGDLFSAEDIRRSHSRLNNLQYFEKVDISPVPTGDPDQMDLVVKVKDKPTGRIGGGVGYSTYDSVFFAADISESNLFGKGYIASLNGAFSGRTQAFTASFQNPRLNDTDLGFSLTGHKRISDYTSYDKDALGLTGDLFYPIGEYSKITVGYTAEYYNIYSINSTSTTLLADKGYHFLSQLGVSVSRDTRDNRMNPTTGTVTSLSYANGGGLLGGSDDFMKWEGEYKVYYPLVEEIIFSWRVHGGLIHANVFGGEIPTDQRFKLGGLSNVRGYSSYSIGPLDTDGTVLGGTKAFYTNFELRRLLSKEYGVTLLGFFDAGNTWSTDEMWFEDVARHGVAPDFGLYKSVGVGIHWYSPMGPLGFVYGYGFDDNGGADGHKIEFMMGQSF